MKALIFDSGPLINLSLNGILYIIERLKSGFDGKFFITKQVNYEVFDRPIEIQKFELGALQIESLVEKGILEFPPSANISNELIAKKTKEYKEKANHIIQIEKRWIEIVSEGEMSCLALSEELSKKGYETMIAIDERTTRMLCEDPQTLARILTNKIHKKAVLGANPEIFSKFNIIRSSELVYAAYKKGAINLSGEKVLEALLYAAKFKGTAISFEEIEETKKLISLKN